MMPTDQSHWSCGASQAIAAERLSKVTYMQEAKAAQAGNAAVQEELKQAKADIQGEESAACALQPPL
jgi:hypothetical protein